MTSGSGRWRRRELWLGVLFTLVAVTVVVLGWNLGEGQRGASLTP